MEITQSAAGSRKGAKKTLWWLRSAATNGLQTSLRMVTRKRDQMNSHMKIFKSQSSHRAKSLSLMALRPKARPLPCGETQLEAA